MPRRISEAQWLAMRRLIGGEPPMPTLVAAVANISVGALRERMNREDWPRLNFRHKAAHDAWRRAMSAAKAAMARQALAMDEAHEDGALQPKGRAGAAWRAGIDAAADAGRSSGEEGDGWAADGVAASAEGSGRGLGDEAGARKGGSSGLPDLPETEALDVRLRRVVAGLLREVETAGLGDGRGAGFLDKERMDAIWSVLRTLEKVDQLLPKWMPAEGAAQTDPAARNEAAAETLERIEARIVELAYALADDIAAQRDGRASEAAGSEAGDEAGGR